MNSYSYRFKYSLPIPSTYENRKSVDELDQNVQNRGTPAPGMGNTDHLIRHFIYVEVDFMKFDEMSNMFMECIYFNYQ